jgi:hypothetical protein
VVFARQGVARNAAATTVTIMSVQVFFICRLSFFWFDSTGATAGPGAVGNGGDYRRLPRSTQAQSKPEFSFVFKEFSSIRPGDRVTVLLPAACLRRSLEYGRNCPIY